MLQHAPAPRIVRNVGQALRQRLQQTRFEGATHEATLNLLVAAGHVRERMERALAGHDLTPAQYNVLRILRGAPSPGYPRCEIARRLIERAPDLTRMIDRLERRGLVERTRSSADRRHSLTRITRRGIDLVESLRPALDDVHAQLSARLTKRETHELSRLLEKLYAESAPEARPSRPALNSR